MAKAKKGVVPPQLRGHLFKKGGTKAAKAGKKGGAKSSKSSAKKK